VFDFKKILAQVIAHPKTPKGEKPTGEKKISGSIKLHNPFPAT